MTMFTRRGLTTYWRLLKATKPYWHFFILGVLGTVGVSLTDAGFTWLIRPIINRGFIDRDLAFIRFLPVLVVLIFLFRGVTGFFSTYFISRVARNIVADFRRAIFNHLLKLPIPFFDRVPASHLLSTIIYNVEQVAEATSSTCLVSLQESSLVLGLIGVMFVMNWQLTLLFASVTPFVMWVVKRSSTRLRRLSLSVQQSMSEITHVASEAISGNRVIRLYDGQEVEIKKFEKVTQVNRQRELKMVVTNSISSALIQLLIAILIAIILFFATKPSLHISAGSFASIISAMVMMLRPARRLAMVNTNIQKGIASAETIFRLLDQEPEPDRGLQILKRPKREIVFHKVDFKYPKTDRFALQNISFTVKPAQTVAIVGKSGSGKSTLIQLLPRFYDISTGTITIDGVDIKHLPLSVLRQQFAFVSQYPMLFNDTIANNIAYAHKENDFDKIVWAAQMAHAIEFIEQLPEGFNTIVGDKGERLSGGQRQRIAIARALFRNAPILILDEATSALDSPAERSIQNALEYLQKDRTTLIIAHRLSTIENANQIIVLDKGNLVEYGTHAQLMELQGCYGALYDEYVGRS